MCRITLAAPAQKMIVFFSRRGRHTRYLRDWSSDVCSSDLFFRALLEYVDETRADDLPLLLEISHSRQPRQEKVAGVYEFERQMQLLTESLLNLIRLVVPDRKSVV